MHMITLGGWTCAEQQGLVSQVLLRAVWTQNGSGGWNPGGGEPLLSLRCTISIIVMRTTTHYFPLYHTHTHTHTMTIFARFSDNIYFDIFFWIGMQIEKQNTERKEITSHIHIHSPQPAYITKEYLSMSSFCHHSNENWVCDCNNRSIYNLLIDKN